MRLIAFAIILLGIMSAVALAQQAPTQPPPQPPMSGLNPVHPPSPSGPRSPLEPGHLYQFNPPGGLEDVTDKYERKTK